MPNIRVLTLKKKICWDFWRKKTILNEIVTPEKVIIECHPIFEYLDFLKHKKLTKVKLLKWSKIFFWKLKCILFIYIYKISKQFTHNPSSKLYEQLQRIRRVTLLFRAQDLSHLSIFREHHREQGSWTRQNLEECLRLSSCYSGSNIFWCGIQPSSNRKECGAGSPSASEGREADISTWLFCEKNVYFHIKCRFWGKKNLKSFFFFFWKFWN